MYRIILADDEGLELESLRFILEKAFGDECVIETAKTGRTVIELSERFHPDIAVMDIRMPGINGIDAMREIRRFNTSVRFIVLSAYDSFDYAKEAISLGVSSYLTKPVHRDSIVDALRSAMTEIDSERSRLKKNLLLREKLENAIPMLEAGLLDSLLLRRDHKSMLRDYIDMLDIQEDGGYFLAIDFQSEVEAGGNLEVVRSYECAKRLITDVFRHAISQLMGNRILAVVFCMTPKDEYQSRVQVLERVRELKKRLTEATELPVAIGIGSICPIESLSDSYDQALAALERRISSVSHFNDLPLSKRWEEGYPSEEEYAMYASAEKGDVTATCYHANAFFSMMVRNYTDHPMDVKLKVLELVMRVEYIAFHTGGQTYHFMQRQGYMEAVLAIDDFEKLRQWYLNKVRLATENIVGDKEKTSQSIVEQAKQYIDQHFAKDITLNSISREMHVSPYYFSKLFKATTEQNFIEYLTQLRMENAKSRLSGTNQSVKEICLSIGYNDPNYFSRSFKKYAGLSPSEYREEFGK
ncbi:MAG: response regulator [Eubacteriales bacterium]|nr:response regulator [Eubacteriales bacterium]